MHGLNTIAKLNAAADAAALGPRRNETPMIGLLVVACMGIIKITGQRLIEGNWVHFEKTVNASNPLLDADLVAFHQGWDGPKHIASEVEAKASQHRRIVSADGLWEDCQREAAAFNKAPAAAA